MNRHRAIAAAPVRSAGAAWEIVRALLAETLGSSSAVTADSVKEALVPLTGIGPALIAGGHLEAKGLVLVDVGVHVTITVLTGDAALGVDENLNPVPGGASATNGWVLYVPTPAPLESALAKAIEGAKHLSLADPPSAERSRTDDASDEMIDADALRRLMQDR